jgi:HK97 family phage major capsid protein
MRENTRLRAERAQILREAKQLSDKGTLSPADKRKFDDLMAEAKRLKTEFEAIERGMVAGTLGGAIGSPEDDDFRSSPSSSYFQPPAETRAEREYRKAFSDYLRFGVAAMPEQQRSILRRETRDMGTGGGAAYPGSTVGFFVPVGFVYAVEKALKYYGPMLEVARILKTETGQPLPYPTANDTAIFGELVGEGQQVTAQDLAIGQILFGAYKYSTKLIKVSIELAQDSAFDLEQFLIEEFAIRLGRILNNHFTVGTGTNQPTGILTAALAGNRSVVAVGSSSNDGSGAGANTIGSDDLFNLEHSCDILYRRGAKFMMHDSTLRELKTVKDKYGRPLWMDSTRDGQPATILGYGYAINNDMDVLQTQSSSPAVTRNTILFGDMSKYVIRMAREMSILRLTERFADYGQIAFIGFLRADANLLDAGTHPLTVLKNVY